MTPSAGRVMGRFVHVMRRERPDPVERAREPSAALKRDLNLESEEERKGGKGAGEPAGPYNDTARGR